MQIREVLLSKHTDVELHHIPNSDVWRELVVVYVSAAAVVISESNLHQLTPHTSCRCILQHCRIISVRSVCVLPISCRMSQGQLYSRTVLRLVCGAIMHGERVGGSFLSASILNCRAKSTS